LTSPYGLVYNRNRIISCTAKSCFYSAQIAAFRWNVGGHGNPTPGKREKAMEEERTPTTKELTEILAKLGLPGIGEGAIRAFTVEEDGGAYAVWRIDAGSGSCVLKRAKAFELETYRCFFRDKKPYAPAFYGSCAFGGAAYFLMEYCPGDDLRRCEREKLKKALDALIEMQEEFWQREALYDSALTLEKSLAGIENRGRYLGSQRLEAAYAAFVRIYQTTPRTLCHDDLLPFNLLIGERAVLIDWEYGGLLPYPASFARLIAHGREEAGAFFYMTREDRDFAIQYYYDGLIKKHGIPFAEYRRTLDYFLFYEYCEWVMLGNRYDNRSDERYGDYLKLAEELAAKLLQQGNDPVFQGK